MKQRIVLILALAPLLAAAQPPDYERIERDIQSPSSPFYYPALMSRYGQGDESLRQEDYLHLYYGYFFDPGYDPLVWIPAADSVALILLREPHLTPEDYHDLIRYGNRVLESDPFNPRMLNIMTYAYGMIGDAENEIRSSRRFDGVLEAILSTGQGSMEDSPWHILYFSHAEDVMDYLRLQYRNPVIVSRTTEYFPLQKREGSVRGYFFDYSRIYTNPPKRLSVPSESR